MTPHWSASDIPDQAGKTFVVTGANSGLGEATASAIAANGGHVVLACRTVEKGEAAAKRMSGDVIVRHLDVADLASVRRFADETEHLDVLVNNAGVMATPEGRTVDGFETQMGTNFFGHFALTGLLLPKITHRVVTVSSLAHLMGRIDTADPNGKRRTYRAWPAYGQSKLADLVFAYELHRRLVASESTVRSFAVHPGLSRTELHTHTSASQSAAIAAMTRLGQGSEEGALPSLFAATSPDAEGGQYYGPGGLGEVRGHPAPAYSSPVSRDPKTGAALWGMAESVTGVSFLSPAPMGSEAVPVGGAMSARTRALGVAAAAGGVALLGLGVARRTRS